MHVALSDGPHNAGYECSWHRLRLPLSGLKTYDRRVVQIVAESLVQQRRSIS